jgi:hypothetical protein
VKFALIYGAVGLALLLVVIVQEYFEKRRKKDSLAASILNSIRPERSFAGKIVHGILRPIAGGIVVIVGWPVMLLWSAYKTVSSPTPKPNEAPRQFAVTNEHLVEKLAISEIESRERVKDPLGAVPDLPFGHLNFAWTEFLTKVEPESEFWSFEAKRDDSLGNFERVSGYVARTHGQLGEFFETSRKQL